MDNQTNSENDTPVNQWWHEKLDSFAQQLPNGVLNEMKKRIENGHIQKEKLSLSEDSERIKKFFEKEILRYNKRMTKRNELDKRKEEIEKKEAYLAEWAKRLEEKENENALLKKELEEKTSRIVELEIEVEIADNSCAKASKIFKFLQSTETGRLALKEYKDSNPIRKY